MDNGEPLPSYEGIAAAFAKAKAEKEKEEAQGLRATTRDAAADNKQGEVHFKASHGILVAFFIWISYVGPFQQGVGTSDCTLSYCSQRFLRSNVIYDYFVLGSRTESLLDLTAPVALFMSANKEQYSSCPRHLPFHHWFPPDKISSRT
jgi:hypothetical protein